MLTLRKVAGLFAVVLIVALVAGQANDLSALASTLTHLLAMGAAGTIALLVNRPAIRPASRFFGAALLATILLLGLRTLEVLGMLAPGENASNYIGQISGEFIGRWALLGGLSTLFVRMLFDAHHEKAALFSGSGGP